MSATLLPVLKQRFFDDNGEPLAGGLLYSYLAGTSTPAATYVDQAGVTPNANPVVLDSDGYASVWLGSGSYKFILTDSDGVTPFTVDNVSVDGSAEDLSTPWVEHSVTDGQAATALTGETIDFASYSSVYYDVEIIRGTATFSNGSLAIQNVNGTGRVVTGASLALEAHGVTFSISQASTVCTLRAALSTGPGNGTVKLKKTLIPA
jgi:hypothetical protein